MKKLLASCAALALAATSMLPLAASAAAATDDHISFTATPANATYAAGDTVQIELTIDENTGVNGWTTLVNFDSEALTYDSIRRPNIVEAVPGYPNVTTTTRIQDAPPASDVTDSVKVVWAEGTATYQAIFDDADVECPAEFAGRNYVFTGTNNGDPVAVIRFRANRDIDFSSEADKDLFTISGEEATKNDATDPSTVYPVAITATAKYPEPVTPPPVGEPTITLNHSTGTLDIGDSNTLTAAVTNLTDYTVTWTSSDPAVATVDNNGTVTAVAAGTATITASVQNGDTTISDTCVITVPEATPTPTPIPLPNLTVAENGTQSFDLATLDSRITPELVAAIQVTISDPSIASYSVDGTTVTFTGLAAGSTQVTVTSPLPNYTFQPFTLTVTAQEQPATPVFADQEVTETLTGTYDIANVITAIPAAAQSAITVESSDITISRVTYDNDTGRIYFTGERVGEATVTVRAAGVEIGTFRVRVVARPSDVTYVVAFEESSIRMQTGDVRQLNLVVTPANADLSNIKNWDLTSSDPTVVKFDKNGRAIALRAGRVTVTAKNPAYDHDITCTIEVFSVFPVYNPISNPGETINIKPSDDKVGRAKVTPYVNAIVDSESKANNTTSSTNGPIAATGGEMETETGNAPAIAAAALGIIALGFVVVARKKRHS